MKPNWLGKSSWRLTGRCYNTWSRRAGVAESDLEDLLAEIYTHLVPRLRRFVYCPGKRFRGWLRQSVASAIANFRDSRQRQLGIPVDQQLLAKLAATDEWDELGEEFELAFAERLAVANRIASAVKAKVKPDNWDAFYLTYVEGLDSEEVSARLGVSKGTIHVARCRVRAMLIRAAEAEVG